MENKINKIITLRNGKKYVVLNQAIYKQKNYFFLVGVTDDEENVTDEFRIVQEVEQEGKKFVKDIHDPQLINLLAKYLKPVVEGE